MPLSAGSRLGSYEIVGPLGAGGMGEVYRARDTKLGRAVAIKVILDEFASNEERIGRFEREAKMLAALNHPRIASLFGMEHVDGQHFLVMELIEGETLADRLRHGPMRVEEVLAISVQIADALEAAHEKGVVHRDLKPANVKITPDGQVKVLDFGLAKIMESDATSGSAANSPTLSMMATQAGLILGTAAYMSPEQAKGFPADHAERATVDWYHSSWAGAGGRAGADPHRPQLVRKAEAAREVTSQGGRTRTSRANTINTIQRGRPSER